MYFSEILSNCNGMTAFISRQFIPTTGFYSAPLCKRCTSYGNSVYLSVRPSHAGIVLSDSPNCTVLCAVVLTQYRRVTDGQTDRQADRRN